jgi:hypothetical protein
MCHIKCNAMPQTERPGGVGIYITCRGDRGRERTEMESRQRTCLF